MRYKLVTNLQKCKSDLPVHVWKNSEFGFKSSITHPKSSSQNVRAIYYFDLCVYVLKLKKKNHLFLVGIGLYVGWTK